MGLFFDEYYKKKLGTIIISLVFLSLESDVRFKIRNQILISLVDIKNIENEEDLYGLFETIIYNIFKKYCKGVLINNFLIRLGLSAIIADNPAKNQLLNVR
jgi:hypothetical protein